jgi:hypothetical protein
MSARSIRKAKVERTCIAVWITNQLTLVVPEPEGSSPHSQQTANGPYPEPGESTSHPPINLPKVHFDPISHLRLGLSSGRFPSGFPLSRRHGP